MTRHALLAALALAAVLAAPSPARADHKGKVTWHEPDQGFGVARNDRKPMMVFFTAEW